jgi:hypothetical protein
MIVKLSTVEPAPKPLIGGYVFAKVFLSCVVKNYLLEIFEEF